MQLHRELSTLENLGARVLVIGNGAPHFIAGFRETTGYSGEVFTDPSLDTYRTLQLLRSRRSTINISSAGSAFRALRSGNRQSGVEGDPWQQGGVFIFDTDGEIRFAYPSKYAGDHPALAKIAASLSLLSAPPP